MKDFNSTLSDEELRELLNGLLLAADENDAITQKLMDKEAALVFGADTLIALPAAREKELARKLLRRGYAFSRLHLYFLAGVLGVAALILCFAYSQRDAPGPQMSEAAKQLPVKESARNLHQPVSGAEQAEQKLPHQKSVLPMRLTDTLKHKQQEGAMTETVQQLPEASTVSMYERNKPEENNNATVEPAGNTGVSYRRASPFYWSRIWSPASFCKPPDSLRLPKTIIYSNGEFDILHCWDLDKKRELTAVWLMVKVPVNGSLRIKSHYANIRLVKANGEVRTAKGIWGLGRLNGMFQDAEYIGDFKAKKFIVEFERRIDMVIFFTDAAPGDKVIIDDFAEVVIGK